MKHTRTERRRRFRSAPVAGLLIGAALLLAAGGGVTSALWVDTAAWSGLITLGQTRFTLGEDESRQTLETFPGTLGQEYSADLLTGLRAGQPQAVAIPVTGRAEGNRGLAYRVESTGVTGDPALLEAAALSFIAVDQPGDCHPGGAGAALGEIPAGSTALRRGDDRVLVPASGEDTGHGYLCVIATVEQDPVTGTHRRHTTVTGTSEDVLAGDPDVTAADEWSRDLDLPASAREAVLRVDLRVWTFRNDDADDGGLAGRGGELRTGS